MGGKRERSPRAISPQGPKRRPPSSGVYVFPSTPKCWWTRSGWTDRCSILPYPYIFLMVRGKRRLPSAFAPHSMPHSSRRRRQRPAVSTGSHTHVHGRYRRRSAPPGHVRRVRARPAHRRSGSRNGGAARVHCGTVMHKCSPTDVFVRCEDLRYGRAKLGYLHASPRKTARRRLTVIMVGSSR